MNHWPAVPLGEVCVAKSGNSKIIKGTLRTENNGTLYPAYSATGQDVFTEGFDFEGEGVVLSAVGAHCGKCFLASGRWRAIANTHVIIPKPSRVDVRFLWYLLNDEKFWVRGGAAQPFVKVGESLKRKIPLPPLKAQRRIVTLLDEADELRKLRAEADKRTAKLIPALFDEMFGDLNENTNRWPVQSLEHVISSTKLGLVRGTAEMNEELPYPYVRMDSIVGDGSLSLDSLKRVAASGDELKSYSLRDGDLLFNTRNSHELVGKTGLFEGKGNILFNNNIMRIRFRDTVEPRYMIALFQTDFIKRQLEARKSGTTSVVAIYYRNLRDLKVSVPALSIQRRFCDRTRLIRDLRIEQARSRERLDKLFQSILDRAFRGEL